MLSETRRRNIRAVTASVMLVMLQALKWSIIGRITPFLYMPLAGVVWLIFICSGIASLRYCIKYKIIGFRAFVPVSAIVLGVLIVTFVPFTDLWLRFYFSFYKEARNEIVRKVQNGELKPNVDHNPRLIDLGNAYPLVSMGGNDIIVEGHNREKYVFFFTFRGILDNYSGFLYVPVGKSPSMFRDLSEQQVTQNVPLEENWYFTSHH